MAWLVLVLSIAAVGLMYWLIRRSAATGFASLFYLVPVVTALFAYILFDERLDAISILGMVICAGGVALAQDSSGRKGCKDRKSTRLNSSHLGISYAVFCLKKKKHKT